MIKFITFLVVLAISSIALGQSQDISLQRWQPLSQENVHNLTLAYEFPLASVRPSTTIFSVDLVPHAGVLFISFFDLSANQTGWMLWDTVTSQAILTEDIAVDRQLKTFSFSPNGQFLAVTTEKINDLMISETCLWNIATQNKLNCWDTLIVIELLFTPDESLLILPIADNALIGWNTQTNEQQFIIPQYTVSNAISPNGLRFAFDLNDSIVLWDITTGTPSELYNYELENRLIFESITFDSSGRYIFFMTISIDKPRKIELGVLDTQTNDIRYIEREAVEEGFFSQEYGRLFLFRDPEVRRTAEIVDVMTGEGYGTITIRTLHDYTLAQDIFIAREESDSGITWSVKNFETQEPLFTLYADAHENLLDVRFTQDERFILAYTEGGLVQLWGVPADG